MMIPMGELLAKAKKEGYGVAAPNVFNRETIEACFLAAKKLRAPIILDVAAVHGIYECADIAKYYEKQYPEVPFALNLDHGGAYEDIVKAIHAGFSSVMIDRSTCAYEKNVEEVKEIVKIAHAVGTSVEAELGHVGNETIYEEALSEYHYTDPKQAKDFVDRTGCDSLAVAIGNVHGVYSSEPKLAFDILEEVANAVDVPLVLHGASGIGDEDIKKAISLGIAKINIHTELCQAAMEAINEHKDEPFLAVERAVRQAVKERAMYKIKLFGDDGRADE